MSAGVRATGLCAMIDRVLPEGGQWCTVEKAHMLAALVLALRPTTTVEIGVWMGGSLVPMALAIAEIRAAVPGYQGVIVGIDPWAVQASAEGETGDNLAWWSTVDHEQAFRVYAQRLERLGLTACVRTIRACSNDVVIGSCATAAHTIASDVIDLLHIDGNHTEQARIDAERFLPAVRVGGVAILDDVEWSGGGVSRGVDVAHRLGFVDLYPLDTGLVLQRVRA